MDESINKVWIRGQRCDITYSTLEEIRCNTTAMDNATAASLIDVDHIKVVTDLTTDTWYVQS